MLVMCCHACMCRTAIVAQCDVVWSLMRSFSSGQEPVASLPPKLQRMLMFSLLSCEAGERQQQFTREVGRISQGSPQVCNFYGIVGGCGLGGVCDHIYNLDCNIGVEGWY